MIHDIANYPHCTRGQIVCQVYELTECFLQLISVNYEAGPTELEIAVEMSRAIKMNCLIPTEGPNPFLMKLITPDQQIINVSIDAKAWDREVYIIADRI